MKKNNNKKVIKMISKNMIKTGKNYAVQIKLNFNIKFLYTKFITEN